MPIDSNSTPEQIKDYWAHTNPENFIGARALRQAADDIAAWYGDPSPYEGEGAIVEFIRARADSLDGGQS